MSFLDAFKISIVEVVEEAKRGNAEFAESLLDMLFERLDEELQNRMHFASVHSAINDINEHLQIVSKRHRIDADHYYDNIKDTLLKTPLSVFHARYSRAVSTEDYPLACKCLFQQIETMLSYLMRRRHLVEKMSRDVKFMEQHKHSIKANKGGGYFVPLYVKLILVGDEYRNELGKAMLNTEYRSLRDFTSRAKDSYDACYSLRNADSHGVSFYEDGQEGASLINFQNNASNYLRTPLQLIDFLLFVCIELNF